MAAPDKPFRLGALPQAGRLQTRCGTLEYVLSGAGPPLVLFNGAGMTLELEENPDILAYVAGMKNAPFCVGFAAESEDLARRATEKRARKNVPLLAANLAQEALGADENAITLYDARGAHDLGRGSKLELARKLVAHVAGMIGPAAPDAGRQGLPRRK